LNVPFGGRKRLFYEGHENRKTGSTLVEPVFGYGTFNVP
jgi:hypothetical protein